MEALKTKYKDAKISYDLIKYKAGNKLSEFRNKNSMKSDENTFWFTVIVLSIFSLIIALIYVWDPYKLSEKHPANTTFLVLFVAFLCGITLRYKHYPDKQNLQSFFEYIKDIAIVFFIVASMMSLLIGVIWLFRNFGSASNIVSFIIYGLVIAGAISLIMMLINDDSSLDELARLQGKKNNSMLSLIKKIFLYIPCLLIDFSKYIKEQYNLTTRPVWIVLLFEIVFVVSVFVLPYIFQKLMTMRGTQLQRNPIYLNNRSVIGTFENLNSDKINNEFTYKYAISTWIYLNPQPPNTSEAYTRYATLLDYGQKPVIEYNGELNTIRIQTKLNDNSFKTIYSTTDVVYQKWVNIVINYDGANMDVFMDGKLVGTQPNISPYMTYDKVFVGENNGIHGGICNVMYYDNTLSRKEIETAYNLLKHLDEPVV